MSEIDMQGARAIDGARELRNATGAQPVGVNSKASELAERVPRGVERSGDATEPARRPEPKWCQPLRAGYGARLRRLLAALLVVLGTAAGAPALAQTHCDTTDPNELWCATLTVGQSGTLYGYSRGSGTGSVAPGTFTYRTATIRLDGLTHSSTELRFDFTRISGTIPSDGLLGASNFSLEIGTGADKKTFAINNPGANASLTFSNQGLSWAVNDTVPVKLVRIASFSEKRPELDAPSGTEGWLRVRWNAESDATGVQAYNVEWRTVVRRDDAYRLRRVDKSAREHNLYNLKSGEEYEVRVCELTRIETASPAFDRGSCTGYSRIRMPARGTARSNDVKVSIEFPEGGTTKRLTTSDTAIRWRYRVTGIHNSGPERFQSPAHGVAAGRVVLQYRDETRQIAVYGRHDFGTVAPRIQNDDDLGIRMDWLVFDEVGSGYVEREFRVNQSFRTTTDRGPLMLYLLGDGDRGVALGRLSPHGETSALCVEFEDAQGDVAVPCTSSHVAIDPPSVDGTPGVSGAGADAQWSEAETVGVTVTFSEAVDVDTSGGTPSIGIGLGGTAARSATYASGTGTTELVFEYTLVSGDGSHGFMAVTPDSLALNGGTIRSAESAVDALLAHNGALTSGNSGRSTGPEVTFEDVPKDHDGATAFTLEVQFSGTPTGLSAKRDAASIVEVTGGSVTGARATSTGERPVWEVTVAPDGVSDVTVRVPARACGETHAVCIGGRALGLTSRQSPCTAPTSGDQTQPSKAGHVGKALVGNLRAGVGAVRIAALTPQERRCAVARADVIEERLDPARGRIVGEQIGGARRDEPIEDDGDPHRHIAGGGARCPIPLRRNHPQELALDAELTKVVIDNVRAGRSGRDLEAQAPRRMAAFDAPVQGADGEPAHDGTRSAPAPRAAGEHPPVGDGAADRDARRHVVAAKGDRRTLRCLRRLAPRLLPPFLPGRPHHGLGLARGHRGRPRAPGAPRQARTLATARWSQRRRPRYRAQRDRKRNQALVGGDRPTWQAACSIQVGSHCGPRSRFQS